MRKRCIGLLCALLLCIAPPALANSWGLTGELYQLVSATDEWNDYTTLGEQAGNAAILQNRYHHVLMISNGGKLETYTRAVYQPDSGSADQPLLTWNECSFSLRYHDGLWFTFIEGDGAYCLKSAAVGELSIELDGKGSRYLCTDGSGTTAVLPYRISLADFNISLFPRTINEVRHLNLMLDSLDSAANCLGAPGLPLEGVGKGTAPVYSAPFGGSAWRAANGKAAVGLKGRLWPLRGFRNQDGEEYWCIRYDVSPRTQRIGYIDRAWIDGTDAAAWEETTMLSAQVVVIQETYLTDDPDVSQYPQFTLPTGTQLTCMGAYDRNYAYVSAEVRDGRVTDGGEIVWGFVPLRDLQMMNTWGTRHEQTVMDLMAGRWTFASSSGSAADALTLSADGRYEGRLDGALTGSGSWYVLPHNPASGMYWNDPIYEVTFLDDNGTARVEGLTFEGDLLTLTGRDSYAHYQRVR